MPLLTSTNDRLLSDDRRIRERAEYTRTLRRTGCDIGYAAQYIHPEKEWEEMIEKAGEMRARIRAMRKASDEAFWKSV
jgi:hypothetical protein